ncbi:hypothetical protein [Haliangium ochraceum]|uniref:Putative lipoprotein n=1 Tax=Haliangium ochraceum (strain DSM 14365 / JCM 11303 / SMP-2) TaxID=502025 RepID=D0LQ03_HALO1|nr:hypothetical protein [Haliangium ochraceum]ACY17040.1 putative lipoprotein [Haliangium ochraceum DSM 14365]
MRRASVAALSVAGLLAGALAGASCKRDAAPEQPSTSPALPSDRGLRGLAEFDGLAGEERALALFDEVGKVILHPRCVNCHPSSERPTQGEDGVPHQPLVLGLNDGTGADGLPCTACHGETNFRNVPGNPKWHLAPIEMAWQGRTLGEICAQISDPARNGGKDMAELAHHMAEDELVAYGWNPPEHLEPAPGNQALFGQLFQAWIDAGAVCPQP